MAISEERASSDLETSIHREKNVLKEDLDEVEAKVDELNLEETQQNEASEKSEEIVDGVPEEYVSTINKQNEMIQLLIKQTNSIFEGYQRMRNERDYYEELNDALVRCLEMAEGNMYVTEEMKTSEDEEENQGKDTEEASTEEPTVPKEKPAKVEIPAAEEEIKDGESSDGTATNEEEAADKSQQTEERKTVKISAAELTRINRVLLRETCELRHQLDVMTDYIREHLSDNDDDQDTDEYESASDDDHVCEMCNPELVEVQAKSVEEYENNEAKTEESE